MEFKRRVGSDIAVDEEDALAVKRGLRKLGLYSIPRYGLTPYPDEAMFEGVRALQARLGLEPTGSIRPGGPEEEAIGRALEGDSPGGGDPVHVDAYTHSRHGHKVGIAEHTRSAPGGGGFKGHNGGRRSHALRSPEQHIGKTYANAQGNTECVEFIRQTLGAPHTSRWHEGTKIRRLSPGETDPIPPGSAIATFENGTYPQEGNTGKHAAIYLGQDENGIQVLDQWRRQERVLKRTIPWERRHPSRDVAPAFSAVEW